MKHAATRENDFAAHMLAGAPVRAVAVELRADVTSTQPVEPDAY